MNRVLFESECDLSLLNLYVPGKGPRGSGEVREIWLPSEPPQVVQGWSDVLAGLGPHHSVRAPLRLPLLRRPSSQEEEAGLSVWDPLLEVRLQRLSVKST